MLRFTPPFGSWLKKHRRALDLTQTELAHLVGCAPVTIHKIESGYLLPSRQIAQLLAKAFEIPAAEIPRFIAFARGAALPTRFDNLPRPLNSLIGRAAELAHVQNLLHNPQVRLVTLVGPPGVGKTRLAVEVARGIADSFENGVCFVDLTPLPDEYQVISSIALSLGLRGFARRDLRAIMGDFLRDKQLLCVLDNFEHVLPAALHVSELLAYAPHLKVLSTSRAPLRISGEHIFDVEPLELPPWRPIDTPAALRAVPAVELFLERACAARSGFTLTPDNASDVAGICRRLDGLPLALELAASRVRLYTPSTLLDRLNHKIGARFRALSTGDADLPRHHHTLSEMIDWSYNLLDEPQQQLFRRLAVFVGGCDLEAVETVCDPNQPIPDGEAAPALDVGARSNIALRLGALVDHSLVQQSAGFRGAARYAMLETIRDFALQQLDMSAEAGLFRRRHAEYFSRLCQFDLGSPTWAARSTEALKWVASEHDNLYAALVWSRECDEDPSLHLYLACAIGWLVHVGGWYLGMNGGDPAIEFEFEWSLDRNPDLPAAKRASLLTTLAMLAYRRGEIAKAHRIMAECMPLSQGTRNKWLEINACHIAAWTDFVAGDFSGAGYWFGRQFELARECADKMWMLNGLNMLGRVAIQQQDYARASSWLEQALELAHEMGVQHSIGGGVSTVLRDLAVVAYEQGRYAYAYELAGKAAPLFEERDRAESSWLDLLMGRAALAQGDIELAEQHLVNALKIAREYSQAGLAKAVLSQLARIANMRSDQSRYVRLMAAVDAPPHVEKSLSPVSGTRLEIERLVAQVQTCLGNPELAGEWDAGRLMGLHEAIDFALAPRA